MAQAAWVEIQQQQRVRVTAYVPAWALGGCALLLLACGAVATLGAYDQRAALARLLAVAAGVGLCCVATWIAQVESAQVERMRLLDVTGFVASLAVLGIAAYVFVQHPANGGPAAGALVALLPLALVTHLHGRGWANRRMATPAEVVALAALALGTIALLLTGERSALLALLLGVLLAGFALWLVHTTRYALWILGGVALLGGLALSLWLAAGAAQPGWLADRVDLWRDALPLIGDYRFTGTGPANTELTFASYALLTHVPYVAHVHNLYMQVALEYGLFGLFALLGVFAAALAATLQALRHGTGPTRNRAAAVLASLVATLLLGLVDSEVAASLLVTALFAPPAAALLVQATARADAHAAGVLEFPERDGPPTGMSARPGLWLLVAAVGIVPVLLVWGVNALSSIQAAWEANRGATIQARVELTDYANADWAFQDAIRRERAGALFAVEQSYRSALLLYPAQETAHRRLGQIALSLGDVERAAGFLQEAHRLNPGNRASAQLLGEVRALQGDAAAAAALWEPLAMTHNQLETRLNWYRALGATEELAKMEAAVTLYAQDMQAGVTQ